MADSENESIEEQRQVKSLDQLQEWSKWMVGIETVTLVFSTSTPLKESALYPWIIIFGTLTILIAAWVLSGIPSVTRRVKKGVDLVNHKLYDIGWLSDRITLNNMAILQHILFGITVILVGFSLLDIDALTNPGIATE